ncbi:MAG: TrkA family potassium uptake protein [Candidatus Saganbacteria bacterium]|nr:TrkA family potassium uptake protein [Candidatus Saganbacteria bacterium]
MHIIIVGCGRVGANLGITLSAAGHNVVVVDKNPASFKRLGPTFNGITITGIGFDPEVLKRAGIERADALAAVTSGDNSNIMTSQVAKKVFKVPRVITRIYDPERANIFKRFGLQIICTSLISSEIFNNFLLQENKSSTVNVGKDSLKLDYIVNAALEDPSTPPRQSSESLRVRKK